MNFVDVFVRDDHNEGQFQWTRDLVDPLSQAVQSIQPSSCWSSLGPMPNSLQCGTITTISAPMREYNRQAFFMRQEGSCVMSLLISQKAIKLEHAFSLAGLRKREEENWGEEENNGRGKLKSRRPWDEGQGPGTKALFRG